jgi:TATA-box binding protein (TBP) (component of TFIID and TFIIIB)
MMNLHEKYPKIFEKLEDKELELRHLLNIDENEMDYDSEEFEFDPDEFNYIVYIAEPIQNLLDEEKMHTLIQTLGDNKEVFDNFFASEIDLYGVKSTHDTEKISTLILETVEALV